MTYKRSCGVILCRKNDLSKEYEVLLVRRRYTYAFCDFVCGRYTRYAGYPRAKSCISLSEPRDKERCIIQQLIDRMTVNEMLDVMSLDFDKIWYRIWLSNEHNAIYNRCKKIFEENFRLLHDIEPFSSNERVCIEDLWGLPKGRPYIGEQPDTCAIRELGEETGIDKTMFTMIDTRSIKNDYLGDDGVFYCTEYYVCLSISPDNICRDINKKIYLPPCRRGTQVMAQNAKTQYGVVTSFIEIDAIKWMSKNKIRALDNACNILPNVNKAIKLIKAYTHPVVTKYENI